MSQCTVYGGIYCFKVTFLSDKEELKLSNFNYKNGALLFIRAVDNEEYYSTMFKAGDDILLQAHPYKSTTINAKELEFYVSEDFIGHQKDLAYKLTLASKKVALLEYQFYEIDRTRT